SKVTAPCSPGDPPTWIENAYELLDEEGEWYLNRSDGYIYYRPRGGEDMATAQVIAPVLESLIDGAGTLTQPLRNLVFEGLTFAYATWLVPSTDRYWAGQAGFQGIGSTMEDWWDGQTTKTPASIAFRAAHQIRFERNVFIHLGASGLSLEYGSRHNKITGNVWTDISAAAISIGHVNDHHPCGDAAPCASGEINEHNTIANNYIARVGREYLDHPAIWVGYTDNMLIEHNEISDVPYTGISLGWGWGEVDPGGAVGYTKETIARNNRIQYNLIRNPMQVLRDGGAIYTLGSQPGTTINHNAIINYNNDYGAIYLDNGSRHIEVFNNVVQGTKMSNWLYHQNESGLPAADNVIKSNYSDSPNMECNAVVSRACSDVVSSNTMDSQLPEEALRMIEQAGLEPAYREIRQESLGNLALKQPAFAYYSDGTLDEAASAELAVDNDDVSYAVASKQWLWQLQVDLGELQHIGRIRLRMPEDKYATSFQLATSSDGSKFQIDRSVMDFKGGVSDSVFFSPVKARFLRIIALKPDGAGQPGGQMAIARLEVFSPPATAKTKSGWRYQK
ncbi:hypothetical protein PA598K_07084, partial [Paenibacillus sp. 598K]|uniref:right-handed parallel beta-helix repeat-containing protein n=1 Tax=Paenibacillus sp. 598K TaxID=1117987 RepID=UPI000FF9E1E1